MKLKMKIAKYLGVCGHISFGVADCDSLEENTFIGSTSFVDFKLPLLPLSSIATTELLCQGQYGQTRKAIVNGSIIRPKNSTGAHEENCNRKFSVEKNQVILSVLNENSLSDTR